MRTKTGCQRLMPYQRHVHVRYNRPKSVPTCAASVTGIGGGGFVKRVEMVLLRIDSNGPSLNYTASTKHWIQQQNVRHAIKAINTARRLG